MISLSQQFDDAGEDGVVELRVIDLCEEEVDNFSIELDEGTVNECLKQLLVVLVINGYAVDGLLGDFVMWEVSEVVVAAESVNDIVDTEAFKA